MNIQKAGYLDVTSDLNILESSNEAYISWKLEVTPSTTPRIPHC